MAYPIIPPPVGAPQFKDRMIDHKAYVLEKLDARMRFCCQALLGALAMGDQWYGGPTRNPVILSRARVVRVLVQVRQQQAVSDSLSEVKRLAVLSLRQFVVASQVCVLHLVAYRVMAAWL